MISFISVFLELLIFFISLFIRSLRLNVQKSFAAIYYHVKPSNVFCLHLYEVYFKQLKSVQMTTGFLKICPLYRPLLIKHLLVNKISINTVLIDKTNFTYFNKEYKSKLTFQYPDGPVCTSHNIPSCVSFQYPVRSSLSNVSFLYLQYDSIV